MPTQTRCACSSVWWCVPGLGPAASEGGGGGGGGRTSRGPRAMCEAVPSIGWEHTLENWIGHRGACASGSTERPGKWPAVVGVVRSRRCRCSPQNSTCPPAEAPSICVGANDRKPSMFCPRSIRCTPAPRRATPVVAEKARTPCRTRRNKLAVLLEAFSPHRTSGRKVSQSFPVSVQTALSESWPCHWSTGREATVHACSTRRPPRLLGRGSRTKPNTAREARITAAMVIICMRHALLRHRAVIMPAGFAAWLAQQGTARRFGKCAADPTKLRPQAPK